MAWEDMPYRVREDLSKMRDANGSPLMICPVDTYFLVNPGQPLLIPDAKLEMPSAKQLPEGVLREEQGNVTYYKDKNLTTKDVDTLFVDKYDELNGYSKQDINEDFMRKLNSMFFASFGKRERDLPDEDRGKLSHFAYNTDVERIFSALRTKGIREVVDGLFEGSEVSFFDDEAKKNLEKKLEGYFIEKIRDGGFFNVLTSSRDRIGKRDLMLLAASWGTKGTERSQAHGEDPESGSSYTNSAGYVFDRIRDYNNREITWYKKELEEHTDRRPIKPRLRLYPTWVNSPEINPDDRKSVMEAFRASKVGVIPNRETVLLPEVRRMLYVAGMV